MDDTDYQRAAALAMLASGQATLAEVAELAQTSRQLVRYWATYAGIDAVDTRRRFLSKAWRTALKQAR